MLSASEISWKVRLQQVQFLLYLLLKFKLRRILILLIAISLIPSNFWLLKVLSRADSSAENIPSKLVMTAEVFPWKVLISSQGNFTNQIDKLEALSVEGKTSRTWISKCDSKESCNLRFYKKVRADATDSKFAHLSYSSKSEHRVECSNLEEADLICPFLHQLMLRSLSSDGRLFRNVEFASYTDTTDREIVKSEDLNVLPSKKQTTTICDRIESTGRMGYTITVTVLYHILIATAGCMVYFTASTIAFISGLKENGFLQLMFSNGLSVGAYWTVIITSIVLECAVFAAVIAPCYALQCSDYFPDGSAVKFGLLFFAYCYSMVSLSLLLTVVLRTFYLVVVSIVAIIMAMVSITVVGVINLNKMEKVDYLLNTMLVFPPGHVVQYSLYILRPYESAKWIQVQEDYLRRALTGFIVFPIVVTLLTIYIDFLVSTGNGLRLPPTYIFSPKFWMPRDDGAAVDGSFGTENQGGSVQTMEPVLYCPPAIQIKDLSVCYHQGCCSLGDNYHKLVQALDSVTCTIYKDQITALIGHNGAGKTTLIRALTGELAPTSRKAIIGNRRVQDPYQCVALRRIISVCSQRNMLSQQLTVMETLKLAALSKGFTLESQLENATKMLEQLFLGGKENVRAVDLSGGQLRKLCCIIALLGEPKIVMLDEPTMGLDPVSRRRLWSLLEERRQGRCLIMCTQFMDEADVLADRKLFLTGGRLICAGSSLFLKNIFGCCPTISVSLNSDYNAEALLKQMPPGVKLLCQSNTELQLSVSASESGAESELHLLSEAVKKLEEQQQQEGSPVEAFGVSQATLDDIFMRLEDENTTRVESAIKTHELAAMVNQAVTEQQKHTTANSSILKVDELKSSQLRRSVFRTFAALMTMNLRRQVRSRVQAMCRFVMPLVLISVLGVLVIMEKNRYKLNLDLSTNLIENEAQKTPKDLTENAKIRQMISESVRVPVLSNFAWSNIVCLYDNREEETLVDHICKKVLGMNDTSLLKYATMLKNEKNIGNFIIPNDELRPELKKLCKKGCYILYANSWNPKFSNANRSLLVGQFWRKARHEAPLKPLTAYFIRLWLTFAPTELNPSSIKITTVLPFFKYYSIHNELFVLVLLFSIIPVTFMSDPVEDRSTCVRQQMKIMGLSGVAYWFNTFVIHWIQYLVFALLSTLMCMLWDRYISAFLFYYVWLPLLLMGTVSNLLCIYCIGAMQRIPSNSVLAIYLFFILFILSVVTFIMKSRIASAISVWLVPPLAPMILIFTALKISSHGLLFFHKDQTSDVPELQDLFLSFSDTVHALIAMGTHIFLLTILLIITENWSAVTMFVETCCASKHPAKPMKTRRLREEDEKGVLHETQRLLQNPRSNQNLLEVRNVEKVYPNGVYAVRGVTFGAMTGEIFGLLGQNGAGKTTLMSAIVGQHAASSGEVEVRHLGGDWLESHLGTQRGVIGFCPQHDPLFRRVAVEEHIVFYARIRGVPERLIMKQTDQLIHGLGLVDDRFKSAKGLSGGNKRSLCLAIALLGSPSVVVIDEASSGVDPENKRGIWRAIRGLAEGGQRTVVVTTHSMEEVEALCSRLCIMDRGSMIGFGTVQQLRSRHGKAYTLEALLSISNNQSLLLNQKTALKGAIQNQFPQATVLDDVGASVQFQIPKESVTSLSASIQWLADNKKGLNVQYFSLHQMSLDQIFVNMMRQHAEADAEAAAATTSI